MLELIINNEIPMKHGGERSLAMELDEFHHVISHFKYNLLQSKRDHLAEIPSCYLQLFEHGTSLLYFEQEVGGLGAAVVRAYFNFIDLLQVFF